MKRMLHEHVHDHSLVFPGCARQAGAVNGRDSLLAALVATVWGFNFVVIDWGMHDVPPLLFAAIRFTLVVLPAVFFVPRPSAPWRTVAAVGVFMSLGQFGLLYVAMAAGLPPGLAALVLQAQVIFTIAIAAAVLRERPTRPQVVGVVLGSAGLVVVAVGRGGHVTRRRADPVRAGRAVLGHRQRRLPRVRRLGRPLPHRLVGGRRPGAAVRALPGPRRPVDRGLGPGRLLVAGGRLHPVHRGTRVARRLRHLQHAARPQPVVVGRAVGPAWLPSWRWPRPGCSSTSSPRRPS